MSQRQDQTEKGVPVLLELLKLLRKFHMEKREFRTNNMAVYKYLKGHKKEVGLNLFSITNY